MRTSRYVLELSARHFSAVPRVLVMHYYAHSQLMVILTFQFGPQIICSCPTSNLDLTVFAEDAAASEGVDGWI